MGVAYEFVHVGAEARRDGAYRSLNPLGQIPTLVDGAQAVCEAAAICLYLCDRDPHGRLAPPPGSPERGRFYQWLFFLSNTLQPAYMQFIYPDKYCADPAAAPTVAKAAAARIVELWRHIERALEQGPFLLGEAFSACDAYPFMLSTWHRQSIVSLADYPRVQRHIDVVARRPAIKRMMVRNAGA